MGKAESCGLVADGGACPANTVPRRVGRAKNRVDNRACLDGLCGQDVNGIWINLNAKVNVDLLFELSLGVLQQGLFFTAVGDGLRVQGF